MNRKRLMTKSQEAMVGAILGLIFGCYMVFFMYEIMIRL
jgi:hypothetical protein